MRLILSIALIAAATAVRAQNINLVEGKVIAGSKLRRDGNTVLTTVPVGNGLGEIGYAVSQIASIDFPEAPQIKEASGLIAAGKWEQALAVIEPVLTYYRPFRDIKGSFWGDCAVLKLQILTAMGRDRDADPLIRDMLSITNDAEVVNAATAAQGLFSVKMGKTQQALATSNDLIKQENADSATLAIAYVTNGHAHLALKEYEDAIFAYLHLPIFFPDQKLMMPPALLGTARCFLKLQTSNEFADELDRAIKTLVESFPNSPEAALAKTEFPNVISRIQKSNP